MHSGSSLRTADLLLHTGAVCEAVWPALPSIARWAALQPATPQQLEELGCSEELRNEVLSAAELLSMLAEHTPPERALQQSDVSTPCPLLGRH